MTKMIINEDGIEREATAEEIENHAKAQAEGAVYNAALAERQAKRLELISRLGITEEEAALLF